MRTERPLTPRQRHVLLVLSLRGTAHCKDWGAWFPLREEQVRPILNALGLRGLVDIAGIHVRYTHRGGAWGNSKNVRTYKLTAKGRAAVDVMTAEEKTSTLEGDGE